METHSKMGFTYNSWFHAARKGNAQRLREFIEFHNSNISPDDHKVIDPNSYFNLNKQNYFGRSALQYACRHGHLECVKLLLESGHCAPSLFYTNENGWNCFHDACLRGHSQILHYLFEYIEHRAHEKALQHLNDKPMDHEQFQQFQVQCHLAMLKKVLLAKTKQGGSTPLHIACIHNKPQCCKEIINCLKNCNASAGRADTQIMQKFLRIVLQEINKAGLSALHMACNSEMNDIALMLIDEMYALGESESCICWCHDNKMNALPIHYACLRGMTNVVRRILEVASLLPSPSAGGLSMVEKMLYERDSFRNTPLHYACHVKSVDIVQMLLNTPAYPPQHELDHQLQRYLNWRRPDRNSEYYQDEIRPLVNAQNKHGHTPLHVCCKSLQPTVGAFVPDEAPASLQQQDLIGLDNKNLDLERMQNLTDQEKCILMLLRKGADPSIRDKNAKLAIDFLETGSGTRDKKKQRIEEIFTRFPSLPQKMQTEG